MNSRENLWIIEVKPEGASGEIQAMISEFFFGNYFEFLNEPARGLSEKISESLWISFSGIASFEVEEISVGILGKISGKI